MHGYSDRINHALAFAAKHRAPRAPVMGTLAFTAHPSNVAIILARHGADETTIVAAILHHVLEITPVPERPPIERKISEKFGSVVLVVATDAAECCVDDKGGAIGWTQRKRALLSQLMVMETRALDICCADEIHECGSTIALIERLGPEYLEADEPPSAPHVLGWYGDLVEVLTRRVDWPARGMRQELATLRDRLAASIDRSG